MIWMHCCSAWPKRFTGEHSAYRYGIYLLDVGRLDESGRRSSDSCKIGFWNSGTGLGQFRSGPTRSPATEIDPQNAVALMGNASDVSDMGQSEQSLAYYKRALELLASAGHGQVRTDRVSTARVRAEVGMNWLLGAFHEAAIEWSNPLELQREIYEGRSAMLASFQSSEHDLHAAGATMADPLPDSPGRAAQGAILNVRAGILIAFMAQDWSGVLRGRSALEPLFLKTPRFRSAYRLNTEFYVAIAEAGLGRFDDAQTRVNVMPADCYPCLIARGQIADMQGQYARADWWFDRAAKAAPSIPFAYCDWGQALLQRGRPEAATEKFELANRKGPHFADPLEGWGEALMAKNQSHRALAKFEEAEKYAPNWGRLHLKWGEALVFAGKKDEAEKQFALTAGLDLPPGEKAELARQSLHA